MGWAILHPALGQTCPCYCMRASQAMRVRPLLLPSLNRFPCPCLSSLDTERCMLWLVPQTHSLTHPMLARCHSMAQPAGTVQYRFLEGHVDRLACASHGHIFSGRIWQPMPGLHTGTCALHARMHIELWRLRAAAARCCPCLLAKGACLAGAHAGEPVRAHAARATRETCHCLPCAV